VQEVEDVYAAGWQVPPALMAEVAEEAVYVNGVRVEKGNKQVPA
jgi:hypothetical protein